MQTQYVRLVSVAAVLAVLAFQTSAVRAIQQPDHQVRGYVGTLSHPRVSNSPDGHVIVSLDVNGDIRGQLTLNLANGGGGGLDGTWALMASYLQDLNPDGSVNPTPSHLEPNEDHAEHREYIQFVNDGSLQGTITGVAIRTDAGGAPTGIDAAQVVVSAGTVKFTGAKGSGGFTVTGTDPVVCAYSFVF